MIQRASAADAWKVAQLAVKMWSSHTENTLAAEFESLIADENAAVFVCFADQKMIGFAQCQLRFDYVEGTRSSPVGYLEGVFVDAPYRARGYGKQLVAACEMWVKEKGCSEFASDCELSNQQSLAFHLHSGFTEANRIICFTKML